MKKITLTASQVRCLRYAVRGSVAFPCRKYPLASFVCLAKLKLVRATESGNGFFATIAGSRVGEMTPADDAPFSYTAA